MVEAVACVAGGCVVVKKMKMKDEWGQVWEGGFSLPHPHSFCDFAAF